MSSNGLITVASKFSVGVTLDRLTAAVTSAGLLVFTRINHARNAEEGGLELRPTELPIFGHPKGGTPSCKTSRRLGLIFRSRLWPGKMKRERCG